MWFAQQIIMSLIQLTAWICKLTCFLRRVCVRLCGAAGNWTGLLRWGFSFLKNIPVYGWCQRGALIKTLLLKWKRESSVLQTYINTWQHLHWPSSSENQQRQVALRFISSLWFFKFRFVARLVSYESLFLPQDELSFFFLAILHLYLAILNYYCK